MRKNISAIILGILMVLGILTPAFTVDVNAEEIQVVEETTTIPHTKTSGVSNYFTFSETGWSAMGQSSEHVWSDTPSADNPSAIWYEVKFVGHKIDIYAGKNWPMGKVKYYIDGQEKGEYSLYNDWNINSTFIASFDGLEEGVHTFRAEATEAKLIDCAEVIVYHAPYTVNDFTVTNSNITLPEGKTEQIAYTVDPEYVELSDVTYTSANENVAAVDENGVITAGDIAKVGGTASTTITMTAEGKEKTITVTVTDTVRQIAGSIVDTDTQWTEDRYAEVEGKNTTSASLTAWKNDKAASEIALISVDSALKNVTVTASDLTSGDNTIAAENVTATFIKSTKAYNGPFLGYGSTTREVPADDGTNRSESSDILYQTTPINVPYENVQPVWVEFTIPKDAEPGTYTGTLTVTADEITEDNELTFTYTIEVQDATLPDAEDFADTFDIMQWQYPYSSAEYYGVDPFSEKHLEILKSGMEIYKEIGGNAITATFTEEAWSGQTYSSDDVHYPSMVKWTKQADGSFTYDYSDLDAWISFCKGMGLGEKIVLYGIAPWHHSFTYWENDVLQYESFYGNVGGERYTAVWTTFLTNLAEHLEERGWLENAYIGIDERGINASAFDLAEAAGFKTAADIDNITNHWAIAQRVTDLNVGDTAAQNNSAEFAELLEIREAKGYKTTLYSCTEHQPGQFSLSAPVESYWAVLNAGMMGADGFNRWAYDAWVADPLNDTTHNAFEAGDCFVIFPDEKDAENPTSKYSVRLARMAEGVRDVNKLAQIAKDVPSLSDEVEAVYDNIQYTLTTSQSYMSDEAVAELAAETNSFKEDLKELTETYILLRDGGSVDELRRVAYYSFDHVTDGKLVNEWADDRNGTIADSATTAEGKQGNALSVNTAGEGAVIADSSDLDKKDWTVGYWVKTTSDFDKEISVLEDSTQAYSFALRLGAAATRSGAGFRVGDNDGDVLTYKNCAFVKDTWYHLTWVQDKDTGLSLYVNGVQADHNTWTVTNFVKAPIEVIGGTGFTGLIDEVKIYNAVLTPEEIAASMQVKGINLAEASAEVFLEDTYQIEATLISDETDKTLTYTSADESIAAVDENGLVTGVGRGTTTITVKNEAAGYQAVMTVTVSVEISILNELTKYVLPEKYQSDVEGPHADNAELRYLGQPDMVQTETGRLITVFPVGHGHGPLIMKYSDDQGETWTEMPNTPESWDDSQETPTIYSLKVDDGKGGLKERLVLICACPGTWGNYTNGWDFSYSDDNGETWTEFEHFWSEFSNGTPNDVIVGMASLVQLKDEDGNDIQKWMGVYHNGSFVNYKTYLTFDKEGNPNWTEPVAYLSDYRDIESSHEICEVGMFRSPDGERIVALARNQTHSGPATMFYSDDEGETWSEPVELPGSLAGERHKALYDPISGKLVITFREIIYDRNNNGVYEPNANDGDWTAGEWVAWVGDYEDIMNLQQGDYMIVLDEDFAANYYSGDTGYTGMAVLEDGTFVLHSYGHWDEVFSKNYVDPAKGVYEVRTDLCWIRQAKFKLADIENANGLVSYEELQKYVDEVKETAQGDYTEESWKAFDEAFNAANDILTNKNVQQVEVDEALATLKTAFENLAENPTVDPNKPAVPEVQGVTRIFGNGRIDTGLAVAEEYKEKLGVDKFKTVIIATGKNFADALPGSYLAYVESAPILLTSDARMKDVVAYVKANLAYGGKVYILGGTAAVSGNLDGELEAAGYTVDRLAGKDRYETNLMILKAAKVTGGEIIAATGRNFADSLSASAVKKPILLVKDHLTAEQKVYLAALNVEKFYIVGGTGAVKETVEAELGEYGLTDRISGANRRETSVKVAQKFFKNPEAAVVASAKNFPDGLCGGPLAAVMNAPLILTADGKTTEAAGYVQGEGIDAGYVLGGEAALKNDSVVNVFKLGSAAEILVEK